MQPRFDPPLSLVVVVVLGSSACEASKTTPKPEDTPTAEAVQTVQAPVFQGEQVTLPPQFAGLEFGMTQAEAQAVVPSMDAHGRIPFDATPHTSLTAKFGGFLGTLAKFEVFSPDTDVLAQLTERWGPPHERTELGRKHFRWFNPEAGLRASVQTYEGEPMRTVEFTQYQPLAKFLGDGPELAFQSKHPLLGMTPTELDGAYGEGLTEYFRTQIREQGDEADPSLLRVFPATDWESETGISIGWRDGKLDSFDLRLGYPDDPAGKAEIMALLVKKWGEATELEEQEGDKTKKSWVFAKHPNIRVEDEPEMQFWRVEVSLNP
jgi:hypothetical protein